MEEETFQGLPALESLYDKINLPAKLRWELTRCFLLLLTETWWAITSAKSRNMRWMVCTSSRACNLLQPWPHCHYSSLYHGYVHLLGIWWETSCTALEKTFSEAWQTQLCKSNLSISISTRDNTCSTLSCSSYWNSVYGTQRSRKRLLLTKVHINVAVLVRKVHSYCFCPT